MKENEFFKLVGERLKEIRLEKGYTAYDTFAYTKDIPRQNVMRAETGKDLRLSTLLQILNALEVSPEEFFKGIK